MPEMKLAQLTGAEALEVKNYAAAMLGVCRKMNDIIGTQIFKILSLNARVIYFPLGKDSVWGFTRIKGSMGDGQNRKPFVVINSSIPIDCQVFAAAHELYHIWKDDKVNLVPADVIDEITNDRNELKANRFAAETDRNRFLNKNEQEVLIARKRYSLSIPQSDERIVIDNLTELAVDAYENKRITFEKLEYLLNISKLKPIDVGIEKPSNIPFPSDDELDKIMEE